MEFAHYFGEKEDASKKEKWRLVVDIRRLNEVTVGDYYPLPLISDIVSALGKARYYTTVDLASGFHQVPLREEDLQKTAFSTPGGYFEFCNMPVGNLFSTSYISAFDEYCFEWIGRDQATYLFG